MQPEVTIVIATYNRPDALKTAIASVLNQSFQSWQLLVIGDHCDDRTGAVVEAFQSPKIKYINLPDRFGEQSGPNSVGMALANTTYLSLLNHDDVWLEDHLEKAVNILKNENYDFYLGAAAFSRYLEQNENGFEIHVNETNAIHRSALDVFKKEDNHFEPASSWVMKTEKAKLAGHWKYFSEIYRTPIADYLMRSWRKGGKFYFSKEITTWSVVTQYRNHQKGNLYNYQSSEHREIEDIVTSIPGDQVRELLYQKYDRWNRLSKVQKQKILGYYNHAKQKDDQKERRKIMLRKPIKILTYNWCTFWLYRLTGIDPFTIVCQLKGKKRGFLIRKLIAMRTGEAPPKPNKDEVIARVKNEVVL